jgi:indole-3-acetate monooxygenase
LSGVAQNVKAPATALRFPSERGAKRRALLEAVDRIRDVLAAGADESEAIRTLAPASVAALRESGLFTLKLPEVLGGAEADPVTQIEVIEAVSQIDPSAGWAVFIGAGSLGLSAYLEDEAIEAMFRGGRIPTTAGAVMPGRATAVPGGYRVKGRWSWGSGIRHAEWVGAHALVEREPGRAPESRYLVMPIESVEIHDNWHVAGLKGTGSCDFSVDDVFVPEGFSFDMAALEPKRGGPLYRMGMPGLVVNELAGFVLGVGRRAIDEIVAQAKAKQRGYGKRTRVADRGVFQRAIGESDLRLRAARLLIFEAFETCWTVVCAGERPSTELQVEMSAATLLGTDAAVEAADRAFRYGGGTAIHLANPLQRCLRDLHAAATHLMTSDMAYENRGRCLLDFPDVDPMAG